MKIAVSAQGKSPESPVDPRFGRAPCFVIYDENAKTWEAIDNKQNLQATQGAGIQSAANVVNAGCGVLISGHCGPKAYAALSKAEVAVYAVQGGTVEAAVKAYRNGTLPLLENADVDEHW
jgi:predicted Fe-Mo cluster-binding NifX family protein